MRFGSTSHPFFSMANLIYNWFSKSYSCIFMSYSTCNILEAGYLPHRYGEFLFMILYLYLASLIGQMIFNFNGYLILYDTFAFAITYIFCRKNPEQQFNVLFIFKLKAVHFPWFYMFFRLLTKGNVFVNLLIGLIAGHSYLYLKEILPLQNRKNYLETPRFMWFK